SLCSCSNVLIFVRSITLKPLGFIANATENSSAKNRPNSVTRPCRSVKSTTATVFFADFEIASARRGEMSLTFWPSEETRQLGSTRHKRSVHRIVDALIWSPMQDGAVFSPTNG